MMAALYFANALDDVSNYTFAGSFSDAYAVANLGDDGDSSPFFVTLGYTYNIGPASLVYFELQNIDNDVDNQDAQTIVRSTFKYDFGS